MNKKYLLLEANSTLESIKGKTVEYKGKNFNPYNNGIIIAEICMVFSMINAKASEEHYKNSTLDNKRAGFYGAVRTIRNSICHGNLDVKGDNFLFLDDYQGKKHHLKIDFNNFVYLKTELVKVLLDNDLI